ncbi:MAG: twin-arginine translocation signal domain-containing protein, partial [Thermoplasmata archaeon]|nr:twin-arginine translocation signal domain-containing protein [Thermoplasmata archaeon]
MDKKITTLYDDYSQGRTNRRDFIRKLTMLAGSSAAALALLPILEENNLKASANLQDDPDLMTE